MTRFDFGQTPDLSKSYNPIPKPYKKVKMPTPVKKAGTKTKTWVEIRDMLKAKFFHAGITECELRLNKICWKDNALSFAHSKKRRKMTEDDIKEVALLCQPCHLEIEYKPEMENIIKGIIAARKIQP